MAEIKTYTIGKACNVEFLKKHNLQLEIVEGKIPFRSFHVARLLKKQLPGMAKADIANFLEGAIYNVDKRTVYRWLSSGFQFEKMYPSQFKKYEQGLPASASEAFRVRVLTRGKSPKVVGELEATIPALEEVVLEKVQSPKGINVSKVLEKREQMLEAPPAPVVFNEEAEMEKLIVRLCEDFATGLITITEACDRHGLPYLQFVDIISRSDAMREVYEQACRIANSIQNSRQLTLVDQRLISLLASGKHETEVISYERHIIPGQLEPRWIEKRKTITKRDLTPTELLMAKAMLVKSAALSSSGIETDLSGLTEAELLEYILRNYPELQKTLSATGLPEIGRLSTEPEE